EKLRRPAAPKHRSSADTISQSREAGLHIRAPRQTPNLFSQEAGIVFYRTRSGDSYHRQVLDVRRQKKRPALEHQNAPAVRACTAEDVVGDDSPKAASTDDDNI